MSDLFSTLLFGDCDDLECFLGEELQGFMGQLSRSQDHLSDMRLPFLVLMGNDDDASMTEELATDGDGPLKQLASVEFVEKMETVRIQGSDLVCSICLDQLSVGSEGRRLPCSHLYHGKCIEEWLNRNKTCPFCRAH